MDRIKEKFQKRLHTLWLINALIVILIISFASFGLHTVKHDNARLQNAQNTYNAIKKQDMSNKYVEDQKMIKSFFKRVYTYNSADEYLENAKFAKKHANSTLYQQLFVDKYFNANYLRTSGQTSKVNLRTPALIWKWERAFRVRSYKT